MMRMGRNGAFRAHCDDTLRPAVLPILLGLGMVAWGAWAVGGDAEDDAYVVTAPGFARAGVAKRLADGAAGAVLKIEVKDRSTGRPTPCRINVVGPDGDFYQPNEGALSPYSLSGEWPKTGQGNRPGKAPIRYVGRFFYTTGKADVRVPAGSVRVEVWKGFEYRPVVKQVRVIAGRVESVLVEVERKIDMGQRGYQSGDAHLHFARRTAADDGVIFDLLEAEDIHYGSVLAYNEPAGPYRGVMEGMAAPQLLGTGAATARSRGEISIVSGQEYRSSTYGHLNLHWLDKLVLDGQSVNANNWPPYGQVGREARGRGGFAVYAHGGYAQSIYADFARRDIDAVELLQFGVYRGIELADWYRMLNVGYRVPCVGSSDYPACRTLGDCRTYVASERSAGIRGWLKAACEGRSFVTTGPMVLLDVDGQAPGGTVERTGTGTQRLKARVRVGSVVVPVRTLQWIVNGRVVHEESVAVGAGSEWVEREREIVVDRSSWIAVRAFSTSASGAADAEAHTNPVYVSINGKAAYDRESLDTLVTRIDGQMAIHRKREFAEKARLLDEFQKSRDLLLKIRSAGGLPATGVPESWLAEAKTLTIDASRRTHDDDELGQFLKPLPAVTPEQALRTFETVDGFKMELVASEPLVETPAAAAFDANGDLYVGEMRDYPFKPREGREPLGTIRLLKDTDGDGRFDKSTVFADELLWAVGIACWKGGIFVAAAPDIWYLKDHDGDGKADERRKVFSGFGTQNQQAMVNNLAWGLDHRVYGSSGGNGGTIRRVAKRDDPGVSVSRSDFRFDAATELFELVSGSNQFGNTFDDWGNRFMCNESHPLSQAVLPRAELARNPFLSVGRVMEDIAGGSVPIFRISAVEAWRQIRSSRRISHSTRSPEAAGVSHHVVDAGAGTTVYRGSAYPPEYYGTVFTGDAQNNLVHRRVLVPDGPTFTSVRGAKEQTTEFVRSSDNWFRPVNFVNAPDGTLYVLDMSRAVIEAIHIPLDVMKHLDLRRGRGQGRIYRMAPAGFVYRATPRLSEASTEELVTALGRADGWYRDTAHRLIYERQDRGAVGPLRAMLGVSRAALPQARVNALWSLHGLGALEDSDLLLGLADSEAIVRAHAVQLSAGRLKASSLVYRRVLELAGDADSRVRFRVALLLGDTDDGRATGALAAIARRNGANRWMRAAVLSSCATRADGVLVELLKGPGVQGPELTELAETLARIVGARNDRVAVPNVLGVLAEGGLPSLNKELRDRLVLALAGGLREAGARLESSVPEGRPGRALIDDLTARAIKDANGDGLAMGVRAEAIGRLGRLQPLGVTGVLLELLSPSQPEEVQVAAIGALVEQNALEVGTELITRLRGFSPAVRGVAVRALLGSQSWTRLLLSELTNGDMALGANWIELNSRGPLLKHGDPEIQRMAKLLFGDGAGRSRRQVLEEYRDVIGMKGDAGRGALVFERACKGCHKVGDRGYALGPDLTGSASGDASALLANILDPNAQVQPNYIQYTVVDRDGRTASGMIAVESATSLTLKRADGVEETLLRTRISEMTSTGQSLMPEGLEKTINKVEMADLVAFLRGAHRGGRDDDGEGGRPLDIGTLPGLIEPE